MLLAPQNLAVSGANQVLHNIVAGNFFRGNIVLVSWRNCETDNQTTQRNAGLRKIMGHVLICIDGLRVQSLLFLFFVWGGGVPGIFAHRTFFA